MSDVNDGTPCPVICLLDLSPHLLIRHSPVCAAAHLESINCFCVVWASFCCVSQFREQIICWFHIFWHVLQQVGQLTCGSSLHGNIWQCWHLQQFCFISRLTLASVKLCFRLNERELLLYSLQFYGCIYRYCGVEFVLFDDSEQTTAAHLCRLRVHKICLRCLQSTRSPVVRVNQIHQRSSHLPIYQYPSPMNLFLHHPRHEGIKSQKMLSQSQGIYYHFVLFFVVCYSGNTYEQLLQAAVDVDFCGCVCFMHFSWGQIACVSLLFLHHFLQGYSLQMFAQVCAISAGDLIRLV